MMSSIVIEDQSLVYVIRRGGDPGLYLAPGVSEAHAIALLEMLADHLRVKLGLPGRVVLTGAADGQPGG